MAESLEWARWPTVGLRGSMKLPLSAWGPLLDEPTSQIDVRKLSLMLSVTTRCTPGLESCSAGPIGGLVRHSEERRACNGFPGGQNSI